MNRRIVILAVVLGVQIVLGVIFNMGIGRSSNPAGAPVLALQRNQVDGIEITGDNQTVKLAMQNGRWQLPDYDKLPASVDGVNLLLDRFDKLEAGTPIATTADARKRFKVDAGDFERRVVFRHGGTVLATVFVGSGASRNRSMLRVDGSDAIREEPIASLQLQTDPAQWADKSALHIPAEQIARIDVAGMQLSRKAGTQSAAVGGVQWTVVGTNGQAVEAPKAASDLADKLAGGVANLSFESVLGNQAKPEYGLDQPVLTFSVVKTDGTRRDYKLGKSTNADWYALQISDRPQLFEILSSDIKPLVDAVQAAVPTQKTASSAPPR